MLKITNNRLSWNRELELSVEDIFNWKKGKEIYYMIAIRAFQERAIKGMKQLAKQGPVTLEEARAQALWIRKDFPNKEEALKFVRSLTEEEYISYINGSK